jgi:3-oxoadipate enol-lactonase
MWDAQADALADQFYVLRYDTRGHGQSARGIEPASLSRLGRDVLGLLDALAITSAHFCGISMGGLTGQWLGIHAPERLSSLVIANSAARIGTREGWSTRAAQVRSDGMPGIAAGAAARWFTPEFIARSSSSVASMISKLATQDPEGYAACCDALADADLCGEISAIPAPTLILAGEHDPVTTVADGAWMVARIKHARLQTLPASHLSNIEAEAQFTQALLRFLTA